MVFDEVDSGIGGAIAEIVGRELRSLGEGGQVLCVTHLPQVASQGHHHLRVAKSTDGRTTRTALTELAPQDRVEEIARMLGGVEVTGKAREHAREMLKTHLDLPPEPSPTDRMPALKAKDLLAQAKVAAQSGKDPSAEPKAVGGDPRSTAGEPRAAAAARSERAAGAEPKAAAAASAAATSGKAADGKGGALDAKAAVDAKGGAEDAKATPLPAKAAADAKPPAKGGTSPGAKGASDDNVIDLNAAKAAGRPASKRR
jgi:hypothetical protein